MSESNLSVSELQTRYTDIAEASSATVLAKVVRWFNDAQNEHLAGGRLRFLRDEDATLTVSSSTNKATLPSDFDEEGIVKDNDNEDTELDYKDPDIFDVDAGGSPGKYTLLDGTTLQIDGSFTADRTLTFPYFKNPTALTSLSETLELPNKYRAGFYVNYALWKFYEGKDDTRADKFRVYFFAEKARIYNDYHKAHNREDTGMTIGDDRPEYTPWG